MSNWTVDFGEVLDTQGGGHGRISQCKINPGAIPCISKPLDHAEGKAYEDLQKLPLVDCIPKFFGVFDGKIVISDLTAGFKSPCMADLKVGTRHYDPNASQEKVQGLIEKQKGSTTDSHGVRLIDGKMRHNGEVTNKWDRKQGLKFSVDQLKDVVTTFLPGSLKSKFHQQLQVIHDKFTEVVKQNPGFRMYASSVLIAYDGDNLEADPRVLLIDFAHTHIDINAAGGDRNDSAFDDGVLKGIETLLAFTA